MVSFFIDKISFLMALKVVYITFYTLSVFSSFYAVICDDIIELKNNNRIDHICLQWSKTIYKNVNFCNVIGGQFIFHTLLFTLF